MSTVTVVAGRPTLPGEVRYFPEAASQSFKKGEFVYVGSDGRVAVCSSDAAGIAGMALQDATGTTNTAIAICLAKRGQQFTLHVTNVGSSTTTANTDVGKKYGLYVASNIHYVDKGDTTNKRFIVDDIAPEDAVGDTNGRLIVEVLEGYAQLDSGTS
jgi:hypothetical protein